MKTVAVGISGGVDSSVAAALLQKQGYNVKGFTLILTDNFDYSDAEKVCKYLNIDFQTIDLRKQFKKLVKNKFLEDYNNGLTPNPCVLCNKYIKFGIMYDELLKLGADYIATGHYAKIENGNLYRVNNNKDQSYFLYNIKKQQLSKILFPLAHYNKEEVRSLANQFNLITANKKESNDVCFIQKGKFKEFMMQNIKSHPGNIIDINSKNIIGQHQGLMNYTIGQRKGLNIGGTDKRLFVVGKDLKQNNLYVALGNDNSYLFSTECVIDNVNWLSEIPEQCQAKFRYREKDHPVKIKKISNSQWLIIYHQKIKSVTPGQSCVLYNDDLCLGGGVIREVRNQGQKLWYL